MTRSLLSLCMIVKNEASNIRAVLEAIKPFVDCWTILDTGSTDATPDIIREVMKDIPGDLYQEEPTTFRFDDARNRVLQLAEFEDEKAWASFQLMLSADEYIVGGDQLREQLESQQESRIDLFRINVIVNGEASNFQPRVFRTGSLWKYQSNLPIGLHEFPVHPDSNALVADLQNVVIQHVVTDNEARLDNIWQNHIPQLRAHLLEQPEDERALVFLAASLEALLASPNFFSPGERLTYSMEAMSMYRRRDAIGYAADAERGHVRARYLACARLAGLYNDEEMYARCEELYAADPQRPEVALMRFHAAARVTPITPALFDMAHEAAKVAKEAKSIVNHSPRDTTLEWKACHSAAKVASRLADKAEVGSGEWQVWEDAVRALVDQGLDAGGDHALFQQLLTDVEHPE